MGINVSSKSSFFSVVNLSSLNNVDLGMLNNYSAEVDEINYDFSDEEISYAEIKKDGFKTQGMCLALDKVLVTGYKSGENSRVYIYDANTGKYEGYIILDNGAHVGGTTYDQEHNILYVTGSSGKVNAYDYAVINKYINQQQRNENGNIIIDINTMSKSEFSEDNIVVIDNSNVSVHATGSNAATTYYYDNQLFVSTFRGDTTGVMYVYDMVVTTDEKNQKHIESSLAYTIDMPTQVQGIAITEYNNQRYLLVSQSIGIGASNILVYKMDKDGTKTYIGKHYFRCGLEGIDVDSQGNVRVVSEMGEQVTVNTTMDFLLSETKRNRPISEAISYLCGVGWQQDFPGAWQQAKENWSKGWEAVGAKKSGFGVTNAIFAFAEVLGYSAAPLLEKTGGFIFKVVSKPVIGVANEFIDTWEEHDMSNRFAEAGSQISNGWNEMSGTISENGIFSWTSWAAIGDFATGDLLEGIGTGGKAIWDYGSDIAGDALDLAIDTGAEIVGYAEAGWDYATDWLEDRGSDFVDWIKSW